MWPVVGTRPPEIARRYTVAGAGGLRGCGHPSRGRKPDMPFSGVRGSEHRSRLPGRSGRVRVRRTGVIMAAALVTSVLVPVVGSSLVASADPGGPFVSAVTFPFNGVWLESSDGWHYWDASGNGLCRIDSDGGTGFTDNVATCDVQAKKPTQAVVGPQNADGKYFVYAADMSSKSGGPMRLTITRLVRARSCRPAEPPWVG